MRNVLLVLSEDLRGELRTLMRDKSIPSQVIKRLEVIRLLDKGCTTSIIARQLNIRQELVRKYHGEFVKGGFAALIRVEKPGKETALTEDKFQALEAHIKALKKEKKKWCLKDLTTFLASEYGISMSEEWLSKRLAMRKQGRVV